MQALQPRGIADIRLAARDVLGVTGVDDHHLEAALIEDLVERDPVDAGRLHRHRLDPALLEPVGQAMQVGGEGPEGPHRLGIAAGTDRCHVQGGADVNGGRMGMDRGNVPRRAGVLPSRHGRHLLWTRVEGRGCAKESIS